MSAGTPYLCWGTCSSTHWRRPGYRATVDLERQVVEDEEGVVARFEVDPFRRHLMLNGLDDIGLTLQHADDISAFERRMPDRLRGLTTAPV